DPYGVAQGAGILLAADGGDEEARGFLVNALLALKMGAAADRIRAGASALKTGLIPWTSRARRFAANVRALEAKDSAGGGGVMGAEGGLAKDELHQAGDGNFQVMGLEAGGTGGVAFLGGLADHKGAVSLWTFDKKETPTPPPVLFDGVGFGWLLSPVL